MSAALTRAVSPKSIDKRIQKIDLILNNDVMNKMFLNGTYVLVINVHDKIYFVKRYVLQKEKSDRSCKCMLILIKYSTHICVTYLNKRQAE